MALKQSVTFEPLTILRSVFWTLKRILRYLVVTLESRASVVFLHALLFITTTCQNTNCGSLTVSVWGQSFEQKGANLQTSQNIISFFFLEVKVLNSNVTLNTQKEVLVTMEAGVAVAQFPSGSPGFFGSTGWAETSLGGLIMGLPWLDSIISRTSGAAGLLLPSAWAAGENAASAHL